VTVTSVPTLDFTVPGDRLQHEQVRAEALGVYQEGRQHVIDELGVEPSSALQRAYLAILRGVDPGEGPAAQPAARRPANVEGQAPAQLPADVGTFTGRTAELDRLDEVSQLGAVTGIGGVGKTALVVHWAHRCAHRFPDGQLYINLWGYGEREPMAPSEALGQLLRGLDVAPERIPADLDEAAALYRSRIADRRTLIVLDNARSGEQVRPLIPTGAGNVVMVTSRDRLTGLVARDGATRVSLDALTPAESIDLLRRMLGRQRIDAEADAARDLATACGHLPLALRIAAATLLDRAPRSIAEHVDDLVGGDRLSALAIDDDPGAAVHSVFEQSTQSMSPAARRFFALLGIAPGVDATVGAGAALAAITEFNAELLMGQLTNACLVTEHVAGRFVMHDLVHDFAFRLGSQQDDRAQALTRLAEWYLSALWAAWKAIPAHRTHLRPLPTQLLQHTFRDQDAALAWLDAERENITRSLGAFARAGLHQHVWQLAVLVRSYLRARGRSRELNAIIVIALASADELQDDRALAYTRFIAGGQAMEADRLDEAAAHSEKALHHFAEAGDQFNIANAHDLLGVIHQKRGELDLAEARHRLAQSVEEYATDPLDGSRSCCQLGTLYGRMGRYDESVEQFQRALTIATAADDGFMVCYAHHNLAFAYRLMGQPHTSLGHAQAQIDVAISIGSPVREARGWELLGDAQSDLGSPSAVESWSRALELYDRLGDPLAGPLRERTAAAG
jgi:tetratricopeptide (TPR) repeat protein